MHFVPGSVQPIKHTAFGRPHSAKVLDMTAIEGVVLPRQMEMLGWSGSKMDVTLYRADLLDALQTIHKESVV